MSGLDLDHWMHLLIRFGVCPGASVLILEPHTLNSRFRVEGLEV